MATNNSVNSPLSGTTGTGQFVGSDSPALTTPNIGTPSSGDLSNCTGFPADQLSGQVLLTNGGTNASLTANSGGVVYSDASSLQINTPGTTGQVLQSQGTAAPQFTSTLDPSVQSNITQLGTQSASLDMGSFQINNLANPVKPSDAANKSYVDGSGSGVYLAIANNLSDVASVSTSVANLGLTIGTDTEAWSPVLDSIATNIYVSGDMIYATSPTTLTNLAIGGANGNVLMVNSGAPSWSSAQYPATTTTNQLLYSTTTNEVNGLPTATNSVLVTFDLMKG